jgi:hypothetical protein
MDAVRDTSNEPLRGYAALATDVERAIRDSIFHPVLLQRRETQRLFQELKVRFGQARDDLDAIGAFQAQKPLFGISHIQFIRNPRLASQSRGDVIVGDKDINPSIFVWLTSPALDVAHLRITKWDRVTPLINGAFERIKSLSLRAGEGRR